MAGFLGSLLTSVIPLLFGGGGGGTSQQSNIAPSVGSMQPSAAIQQPPVTNDGGFLKNAGKLLGNEMLSAFGSKMTAGMRGQATLKYNQNAFPKTNPWEHLGGGARGQELAQLAGQQSQMKQAERASIRQSQTQMGAARMAASSALSGQIYSISGPKSLRLISQILKGSGLLLNAGDSYQTGELSDNLLEAQIGGLRSQANFNRVSAELAPYLATTGRISAGGRLSKEAKGIADLWNNSKMRGTFRDFLKSLGGNNNAATAPKKPDNVLRFKMNP